jgi:hypothetical protein
MICILNFLYRHSNSSTNLNRPCNIALFCALLGNGNLCKRKQFVFKFQISLNGKDDGKKIHKVFYSVFRL